MGALRYLGQGQIEIVSRERKQRWDRAEEVGLLVVATDTRN